MYAANLTKTSLTLHQTTRCHMFCKHLILAVTRYQITGSNRQIERDWTLVDFQIDAQILIYLFIYNTFIKILYMFRALSCSSSGGLRRNCIYAASGIVTVLRWLSCAPVKKELFFLNWCTGQSPTEWWYQRLRIYNYDVDLLKMNRTMLETCRGF